MLTKGQNAIKRNTVNITTAFRNFYALPETGGGITNEESEIASNVNTADGNYMSDCSRPTSTGEILRGLWCQFYCMHRHILL